MENDKKTVEAIANKEFVLKTFDYDGRKYKATEAKKLIPEIDQSIVEIKAKIVKNDSDIYNYFLKTAEAQNRKSGFVNLYHSFADYDKHYEEKYKLYIDLVNATAFISARTSFEQIRQNFLTLKIFEEKLKSELRFHLQNPLLTKELSELEQKDLAYYTEKEHIYFNNEQYFDSNLEMLMKAINMLPYFLHRKYFLKKKEILSLMKDLHKSQQVEKVS